MKHRVASSVLAAMLLAGSGCSLGSDLDQDAREPILRAASNNVERLLSYDAKTLQRDKSEIGDVATAEFAKEYVALLSGKVEQAIKAQRAVSTASVVDAGTLNLSTDSPEVLLFVRQVTTSSKLPARRLDLSAVHVRLLNVNGRWRLDSLERVVPLRAEGATK